MSGLDRQPLAASSILTGPEVFQLAFRFLEHELGCQRSFDDPVDCFQLRTCCGIETGPWTY
jgi:hypothetical protein